MGKLLPSTDARLSAEYSWRRPACGNLE